MKSSFHIFSLYLLIQSILFSQSQRIIIDEDFNDWNNIQIAYSDAAGDQVTGDIDFGKLWISNDNDYLFLRVEVGSEINLQNDNDITIYIDTDNDALTGNPVAGIGAELTYNFGMKKGVINMSGNADSIMQYDIGIYSAPTVTSNEFEIAFSRSTKSNSQSLFNGETIKVLLHDEGNGKDQLPSENGGVQYSFISFQGDPLPNYSLKKRNAEDLRILSYNIHRDDIFDSVLYDNYKRIFQVIKPDIISFQEIYLHNSQETADLIETILPSKSGETWYHSKVVDSDPNNWNNADLIFLSRFPILQTFKIDGFLEDDANFAVLIDLRPKYNTDLLLVNAHPPCCSWNSYRQLEIDKIMAFVREAKKEGGELTLENNTPIVVTGDMNLVGFVQQQSTLLTGDIFDNNSFGEDFNPDWDDSSFEDCKPYTTEVPMAFTWYEEDNIFSPGRLDYIVYSNSVINEANSYVLFTKQMNADTLSKYGLQSEDVVVASDHLPVVVDFDMGELTDVKSNKESPFNNNFNLDQNYPNPFNPSTIINYSIPAVEITHDLSVQLRVYDVLGKVVATLVNKKQKPGYYEVKWNANDQPSGVYFYQLKIYSPQRNKSYSETKKMILLQ